MLSYPSKRGASTTFDKKAYAAMVKVVIPLQTRSFYNFEVEKIYQTSIKLSYPSKRGASTTLPLPPCDVCGRVVIPLQTRSFYNKMKIGISDIGNKLSYPSKRGASTTQWNDHHTRLIWRCHTPPNEELLQPVAP